MSVHRFVLVRHATPSDGDDPGLSARGRAEAMALAKRLAGWRLDAAWSSDMNRAVQTAEAILAAREAPALHRSVALREVELPPEGGRPAGSADYRDWERETLGRLARDLAGWLEVATAGPKGRRTPEECVNVLVVSHAGPLKVLLCLLLGLPVRAHWSFRVDRASLSVVEWTGDLGTITLLNDHCHLEIDRHDR